MSCCAKSGRGVSVDSDDREAGNHVSRRQVISVDSLFASEAPLVAARHFYRYRRLVRRRTLLQPGVSSTLRKTRREVVASRESNMGYPKPSIPSIIILMPLVTIVIPIGAMVLCGT